MSNVDLAITLKNQGNEAYKARNFEEAEKLYKQAYEQDETNLMILFNLAAVYMEQKRYDEGIEVINKALEKRLEVRLPYTQVAKLHERLAKIYLAIENYDEAIQCYKNALLEVQDKKYRLALKEIERLRDEIARKEYINPEIAEQHKLKGNEYFKAKDFPAAKAEYDEAIKRNPQDPKLYSNRAAAFSSLLEFPCALKDCEKALELDPNFVKAYSRKGYCYLQMKNYKKAKEAYSAGLKIDSNSNECRAGLQNVQMAIMQQMYEKPNEEQMARAMADPEVSAIINDPQMQMILKSISESPAKIAQYMADPKISGAIETLISAGVLRFGSPESTN
ncbi:hsp70-Hsp90 organising protein-like [Dermatophagoides farinae]|uniref:hsp70-Hsp90 organising protein-like n=1 Tax=Dermatophagoides farinae TaxID=6954 RepID=UPI003F5DC46A